MRLLILLGILIVSVAASAAQRSSQNYESNGTFSASPEVRNTAMKILSRGADRFSGYLIEQVAKDHRKNLVISPLGATFALAMASFGARTDTLLLLYKALGLSFYRNHRSIGFKAIVDQLNSYRAVELHVATKAFVSSAIEPNPRFIEATTRVFRSPVQKVNFNESLTASNTINEWCENTTNSRINKIVNAKELDENTGLILVNAVYFKGKWLKKFNPLATYDTPFILENGTTKQVLSMNARQTLRYGKYPEVNAKFIELPYQNENGTNEMSMFIVLPNEIDGMAYLEANFHKINIEKLLERGQDRKINLRLPKFTIESEIELKDPLTRMNMGDLFDPFRADFTGIIESPRLVLEKVVQKVFIEINEKGSEAAAATGTFFGLRMNTVPRLIDFIADHPFYAIIATTDENPLNLFTARFTGQDNKIGS